MKTRTKPKTSVATEAPTDEAKSLPVADGNPLRVFIVNQNISSNATIITLAHPRTLKPTHYYMCPETGLYETRAAAQDPRLKRSILLDPLPSPQSHGHSDSDTKEPDDNANQDEPRSTYVLESSIWYTVTPIDPIFLLLPALKIPSAAKDTDRVHFLSADDIVDSFLETSKHLSRLIDSPIRPLLEQRLAAICDTVEAGDELMYRLSERKLLASLLEKAERMSKNGLPATLEDRFVARPLEIPLFAMQSANPIEPIAKEDSQDAGSAGDNSETQSSVDTNTSTMLAESQDSVDTAITTPDVSDQPQKVPEEVTRLQRIRIAMNMIMSMYISKALAMALEALMGSAESPMNFSALDKHLEFIAKAKAEATASRSMSDFSHKRGFDDEETAAERAEKKQKMEDEEKRKKANESRAVKNLKKVNVNGMKKMNDFFKKAAK